MAKYMVLNVVGQVVEATSPDAAAVKGKANIIATAAGDIALSAISPGQVRSTDAFKSADPVSMSASAGSAGGKMTTATLQAYLNNFLVR